MSDEVRAMYAALIERGLASIGNLDDGQTDTNNLLERIDDSLGLIATNLDRIATVLEEREC